MLRNFTRHLAVIVAAVLLLQTAGFAASVDGGGKKFTVSFMVDELPPAPLTGMEGESVLIPDWTPPTYITGQFAGWSVSSGAAVPEYVPGEALTLEENLFLYPVYAAEVYTVTYLIGEEAWRETVAPGAFARAVPALTDAMIWLDEDGRAANPAAEAILRDRVFTASAESAPTPPPDMPTPPPDTPTPPPAMPTPPPDTPTPPPDTPTPPPDTPTPTPSTPAPPPALKTDAHTRYLDGYSDGLFYPNRTLTRAQTAKILYTLLEAPPEERLPFSDVTGAEWYAEFVGPLGTLGIVQPDENGAFRGEAGITRAEFAAMLSVFVPGGKIVRDGGRSEAREDAENLYALEGEARLDAGEVWTMQEAGETAWESADMPEDPWAVPQDPWAAPDAQPDTPDAQPDTPDTQPDTPDTQPDTPDTQPDTPDTQPDTPRFPDVPADYWAYAAIQDTAAAGLFGGDKDGNFLPDHTLTRAQAAAVFNRLLGRVPDMDAILVSPNVRIFPDVPSTFWAYGQIMEASVSHTSEPDGNGGETWTSATLVPTAFSDGFHNIDGWLYRVLDGRFIRSETVGGFAFDVNGRYTTGNAELDSLLTDLIRQKINSSMTRDQKLRTLYNYVRDNFSYLKRDLVAKGTVGWEPSYALKFLQTRKGNCYSYAATFCLLVRELGLNAKTILGDVGPVNHRPHAWVEISLDGQNWCYDTELEMSYRVKGVYSYNLYHFTYKNAPFSYYKW